MTPAVRTGIFLVKAQHVFLAPLIIFGIPMAGLGGQGVLAVLLVQFSGFLGEVFGRRRASTLASIALVSLIIWGKVESDLLRTTAQDTAVLVAELTIVLLLMEASRVIQRYEGEKESLKNKDDELSQRLRERLEAWTRGQLAGQTKIALAALTVSLGLVPFASLTSISTNQLYVSAGLVLVAIIMLVFLVTHRREPETRRALAKGEYFRGPKAS